ncbi:hypothetical protein SAMN05216202_5196 [Pseudomonas mucidolens]|uniref:Uncharacterized protein n=1 Tax=Pseudomonas mucidolens TaxID=46679 RepID=A0A1H2P184_9PSED|nr:hypothetical protein SAMN05216202_5196 [Pseudomonas mucidolens]SQH36732.1 Uncharacterised protein [Pseudomonas mucidolens]
MLHRQRRTRDRDKLLHTSDLALLPAVHVSSDEPIKATDEHTLIFRQAINRSTVPDTELPRPSLAVTGRRGNTLKHVEG